MQSPRRISPRRDQPRQVAGFTLIELMVVIALIAILGALAGPSFRTMLASQRVKSAASAVSESLWLARSEAVKRNATVSFTVNNAAMASGWQLMAGATVLHSQDGFSQVGVTAGGGPYTFNPYGRLVTGAGDLQLSAASNGQNHCVTVSTSGRAAVKSGTC